MTDLSIQDFNDLSSKELVQILLSEQAKMSGGQEPHLKKTEDSRLFLGSLVGPIIKLTKTRRETC